LRDNCSLLGERKTTPLSPWGEKYNLPSPLGERGRGEGETGTIAEAWATVSLRDNFPSPLGERGRGEGGTGTIAEAWATDR